MTGFTLGTGKVRAVLFFSLLFLLYWKAPRFNGVNANSRFNLTKAIVLDHSFIIDKYYANTMDWSHREGHYYTNKAPGSSLLAVPIYAALVWQERARNLDPLELHTDLENLRRADLFVTALPSVVLCFFFLSFLLGKAPARGPPLAARHAWIVLFAYAVATLAFPYSIMLWGHQTAATFLFLAFYFATTQRRPALAGWFASLAVLAVAGLLVYLWVSHVSASSPAQRAQTLLKFCLGALPVFLVFIGYHKSCFGGWLVLPQNPLYHNPVQVSPEDYHKLFGVVGLPSAHALFGILLSTERGLFYLSPVLALAVPGFYRWLRAPGERAQAWLAAWIVLTGVLWNISFNGWYAGQCVGPRYLIPFLPFLTAALIWVRPGRLFYFLLAASALNMLAVVAVDTQPETVHNILTDKIYADLFSRSRLWFRFAAMTSVAMALFACCCLRIKLPGARTAQNAPPSS